MGIGIDMGLDMDLGMGLCKDLEWVWDLLCVWVYDLVYVWVCVLIWVMVFVLLWVYCGYSIRVPASVSISSRAGFDYLSVIEVGKFR